MSEKIFVTQPFLPPLADFVRMVEGIWERKVLTNAGPLHCELEAALCEYLGVKYISLFSSGTTALITALQALRISGEVITTPYSFVATAHSLLWHGNRPVFVDISPDTLNIDPGKIEAAITPQTTAILPVHCYGNPCDVDAIETIADRYNLHVIYDAAHAFGVRRQAGSILNCGELSVLSFHATKVFNTFEGGAIVSHDEKTKTRIDRLKNFGFVDETTVVAPGINGKMSEINAALGLLQLQHMETILARRREVDANYRAQLSDTLGVRCVGTSGQTVPNFAYFPILIDREYPLSRDGLYDKMRAHGVYSRKYFYPLISEFPMYRGFPSASRQNLPVAVATADRVLCLPIYPALEGVDQQRVIDIIRGA